MNTDTMNKKELEDAFLKALFEGDTETTAKIQKALDSLKAKKPSTAKKASNRLHQAKKVGFSADNKSFYETDAVVAPLIYKWESYSLETMRIACTCGETHTVITGYLVTMSNISGAMVKRTVPVSETEFFDEIENHKDCVRLHNRSTDLSVGGCDTCRKDFINEKLE